MELSQFKAMNQKQKLALIAQMRREVESAIEQVFIPDFRKSELDEYAALHRVMRSEILSPTPSDDQQLSPFAQAFFGLDRAYKSKIKMYQEYLADREREEVARQRIDDAVERKVQEQKNRGGRPRVGEKKGITVRMPDDEWVPVRAAINYYGYTDAEFFAEAAKLLAAQRTESMDPDQIRLYGGKGSGS